MARRLFKLGLVLLLVLLVLGACTRVVEPPSTELEPQLLILTVTREGNSGPGTLRRAIEIADPDSTITFADNVRNITLESELVLDKPLTITGPEGGTVTISGNNQSRVFWVGEWRAVTLRNLTITAGNGSGTFNTWSNGFGGGIYTSLGSILAIENSTISGNSATNYGGGIYNYSVAKLTLKNSTVAGNTAYEGGGIYNQGSLTIGNSTVAGNTAYEGGGIYNPGLLTIENSTVSDNAASSWGGGISNMRELIIMYSTITDNQAASGGGVWSLNDSSSYSSVKGSIIAGNTGSDVAAFTTSNRFYSRGYNLIGTAGDNVNFELEFNHKIDGILTDQTNITAPGLDDLADNGGPTLTHALLPGSPALNKIPFSACTDKLGNPILTDQRGLPRPEPAGTHCDVGAFEVQVPPDTTAPTITLTTPAEGASHLLNEIVLAVYSCEDEGGGSGIASCDGTVANGAAIDTSSPGVKTFAVTATDNAGNAASLTHSYSVVEPVLELSIDPTGTINNKGVATVSGSLTCPVSSEELTVSVSLTQGQTQKNGMILLVNGTASTPVTCSDAASVWTVTITPSSGKFIAGSAAAMATVNGVTETQFVQLARGK